MSKIKYTLRQRGPRLLLCIPGVPGVFSAFVLFELGARFDPDWIWWVLEVRELSSRKCDVRVWVLTAFLVLVLIDSYCVKNFIYVC